VAKEWAKFDAEYKKIKTTYAKHTKDEAGTTSQRMRLASANCSEGEANLKSSTVAARREGVTGSTSADFMKNAKFKEAVLLLTKAAGTLDDEVKRVDTFSKDAETAVGELNSLKTKIEKDLKGRRDSSESKKDIEALQDQIEKDLKDFGGYAKLAKEKVLPYYRSYTANLQKTINKILAEAPEAQAREVEGNEAPQKFTDRVLNKYLQQCVIGLRNVQAACEKAIELAAEGKNADAAGQLKQAAATRKEINEIATEYAKLAKDHSDAVNNSKDKSKIVDAIAKMAKADEAAERAVRGVTTTLRKAG